MKRALSLARRGIGHVSPNPPVGAVAVSSRPDGEERELAVGWHQRFGHDHAERNLINKARSEEIDLRGSTLFVTLEPCAHHGKTPPCSEAVIEAGFARVIISAADPNPVTSGKGLEALVGAGVEVLSGCCDEEGRELIAPYLCRTLTGRPLVTAKWAMTADGLIATATGDGRWISSQETRERTRLERGERDAILVGRGTIVADDPLLTCRSEDRPEPLRVVLDSKLSIDGTHRIVESVAGGGSPLLVATAEDAPRDAQQRLVDAGVEVVRFPLDGKRVALGPLLDELGERGICDLLVEGGAQVLGSFFDGAHVDRVQVVIAAIVSGGEGAPSPVAGAGVEKMAQAHRLLRPKWETVGDDRILSGALTERGLGLWP